jgi:putative NADH-flavin reductase
LVEVVRGDARDPAALAVAVRDRDAVISAIGPVAGVTKTEVSEATATVVGAMEQHGPARLVVATNTRVLDDAEVTGEFANVAAEHRRTAAILRDSQLDWTIVAAPFLTDAATRGSYEAAIDAPPSGKEISRGDFAKALLDAVDTDAWIGHVVGVSD